MIDEPVSAWWRPVSVNDDRHPGTTIAEAESRGSPLAFWALIAFTFILLLAPQAYVPVLASLRIALLSAGLAGLAYGVNRLSRGLGLFEFSPAIVLVLLLITWAIVTLPFSIWPGGSVSFLLEVFFKTVLIFLLLTHVIDNRSKLTVLCWSLVLFTFPLALVTIVQFLTGNLADGSSRVAGYSAAMTSNPNDMALWLNLMLPLCIALLLDARRASLKILLGSIAGLMVVAIIATFSRGGLLTLVMICLCYMWLLRKRPQRVWMPVIFLVAMLALPLLPNSYVARIDTIVNIEEDKSGSAQTRLADMKVAAKLVVAQPFVGSGINMNALAMNQARGATWIEVHNIYLQYAVDLGIPGLVLFLFLYYRCMNAAGTVLRKGLNESAPDRLFYIAEGLYVSLAAFALAAFFHPVAYDFYFYYIAGLAIATKRLSRTQKQDNSM